jgi:hypothetical protein
MESKLRINDEDYEDEKGGGKSQNKLDGFSSPRKRLAQAKIQANAIDDEVSSKKLGLYLMRCHRMKKLHITS